MQSVPQGFPDSTTQLQEEGTREQIPSWSVIQESKRQVRMRDKPYCYFSAVMLPPGTCSAVDVRTHWFTSPITSLLWERT